jgi:hypothetical protein
MVGSSVHVLYMFTWCWNAPNIDGHTVTFILAAPTVQIVKIVVVQGVIVWSGTVVPEK